MIKLKRTTLVEEDDSLIGKKVLHNNVEATILDVEEDEDDTFLKLDNGKSISTKVCVERGILSSDDASVNKLLNKYKVEDTPKEEPKKEIKSQKSEKELAIEDARNDFYANPMNKSYFKKLEKEAYTSSFTDYEEAYYVEFKRLLKSASAKKRRRLDQTIDNTYEGDVDELIKWLDKAITSIDVVASDSTYNATKDIVDEWNKRDNTNYEVELDSTKYATQYIVKLTSNEDILKDMPEEVKTWKARKNIGRLNKYDDELVYREEDNTLTSNDLIFDLIDAYKFRLGKRD